MGLCLVIGFKRLQKVRNLREREERKKLLVKKHFEVMYNVFINRQHDWNNSNGMYIAIQRLSNNIFVYDLLKIYIYLLFV